MSTATPEDDQRAALDLIITAQQSPASACAYLGTDPEEIRADLADLDQDWRETLRLRRDEAGRILAAALLEWDEDLDLAWVHGPWATEEGWRTAAPAVLAEVVELSPVSRHEMFADDAHTRLAELAQAAGWERGAAHHVLARRDDAMDGEIGELTGGDLELREAGADDLPRLRALHDSAFPGTYASAAEILDPRSPYRTLICPSGDEIAGYLTWQEQGERMLHLDFLAVHPVARRHGIAAALLDGARRLTGRPEATATVHEDSTAGQAFFVARGFAREAITRPYRFSRAAAAQG
ncbi:GNAT family N-acetyltransferase [Brachybacterium phenoliresistens]|uniref:GNAT family N-acetyltransferase n=1 Tax=Brachybacterium phenoliresistens TaxID=396014 RepID=UPI0031D49104